jgi:hypothetical protein
MASNFRDAEVQAPWASPPPSNFRDAEVQAPRASLAAHNAPTQRICTRGGAPA